jgi:hypothetical protein
VAHSFYKSPPGPPLQPGGCTFAPRRPTPFTESRCQVTSRPSGGTALIAMFPVRRWSGQELWTHLRVDVIELPWMPDSGSIS